jgi:DNA-binding NarL/FixJ family response regulator
MRDPLRDPRAVLAEVVAASLHLAPGTVRKHLENVYANLRVTNRTAAAARLRDG